MHMQMQQGRDALASPAERSRKRMAPAAYMVWKKMKKNFILRQICFGYTEKEIQGNKAGC